MRELMKRYQIRKSYIFNYSSYLSSAIFKDFCQSSFYKFLTNSENFWGNLFNVFNLNRDCKPLSVFLHFLIFFVVVGNQNDAYMIIKTLKSLLFIALGSCVDWWPYKFWVVVVIFLADRKILILVNVFKIIYRFLVTT